MAFQAGQIAGGAGGFGNRLLVGWREDSTEVVLARLAGISGSGDATGVAGEGNWIQRANIASATCKVFDLDGTDPGTPIAEPTVTVADSVLDVPATDIWTVDATGYNFQHTLGPEHFPTGNHRYAVEYRFELTDGKVFHGSYEGLANAIRGS